MKTQKISTRESLSREFLCRKCNSWVYNTRDLIEDKRNVETGISYRKYVCFTCGEVFEFSGQRYLNWNRLGKKVIPGKRRITKAMKAENLKQKAKAELEKIGLDAETALSLIQAFK